MPLDLSLPFEFDDGTPVQLIPGIEDGRIVRFMVPKVYRDPTSTTRGRYWYRIKDGVFDGGDAENFFVVRNAGPAEPEEYEEWFVA